MVKTFSAVALALLFRAAAAAATSEAETEAEHTKRIQNLHKMGAHTILLKHNRVVENPATANKPRLRALAPLTVDKAGTDISADKYHGQGWCGGGQNFLIDHLVQGDTTTSGAEACWAECEAELGASLVAVDAWDDSFLYDFEGVSGSEEERAAAPSCMLHFAKAACEGEASCEWLSSFGGRCREVTGGVTPGAPTSKPSAEPTRSPAPTLEPTVPPTYFAGYKCFCQDKCDCMMNKGPDIVTVKERATDDVGPKPDLPDSCDQSYYEHTPWLGPHADSLVLRNINGAMCMQGSVKTVADPADLCVTPEGGVFPEGLSCTPSGEADAFCSADATATDDEYDGACARCEQYSKVTPAEAATGDYVDDEEANLAMKHETVFQNGMEKRCYERTLGQGVTDNLDDILHKCPLVHQCDAVEISHELCLTKKEEEGEDHCACIWKNVENCWEVTPPLFIQIFHDDCLLRQEGATVNGVNYANKAPCTCDTNPALSRT